MDHTPENLEHLSSENRPEENKYQPRPIRQLVLAWVLIAIVLFAFLGTCYWMINFGRV